MLKQTLNEDDYYKNNNYERGTPPNPLLDSMIKCLKLILNNILF